MNRLALRNLRRLGSRNTLVLILTTTGRITGRPHITPLQYEEMDGAYCVASGRGMDADWIKNLQCNPDAMVEVRGTKYPASAQIITDPSEIMRYLEYRRKKHPLMLKMMMLLEGVSWRAGQADLWEFAAKKTLVKLLPSSDCRDPKTE